MGRISEILDSSFQNELTNLIEQEIQNKFKINDDYSTNKQLEAQLAMPRIPGNVGCIGLQSIQTSHIPIADWTPNTSSKYSEGEQMLRNQLAALYRLTDLFQWSQGIYNHITLRIDEDHNGLPQILINPFGLLYCEVTASSLVKINLAGDVIDAGSTCLGINQAGYVLHSAIHEGRPDVQCIMHLHTPVVAAVSSMKCGLLPICQEAMIIGPVAYYDYRGIVSIEEEKQSIVECLGEKNVMILRNHGFVVCGQSVEDALHLAFHLILSCQTQIRAIRAGMDNIIVPEEKAIERAYNVARNGGGGVNRTQSSDQSGGSVSPKWRIGELEWEAWMRVLDSLGLQTGHNYKLPMLRNAHCSSTSIGGYALSLSPDSCTNGTYLSKSQRLALLKKEQDNSRWINSPNNYQKVEIFETMTDNPKVVTKWVPEVGSKSAGGTPIKINSAHQFTPCGTNSKEFKLKQKELKDNRGLGAISSGPHSQVFNGLTYEDICNAKHEAELVGCARRDHHMVLIGTASKGIIVRDQQHNAQVYRQLYAPNPFANESDNDLKSYMLDVELHNLRSTSSQDYDSIKIDNSITTKSVSTPALERISELEINNLHLQPSPSNNDQSYKPPNNPTEFVFNGSGINDLGNTVRHDVQRSKSTEGDHHLRTNQSDTICWNAEIQSATLPSVKKNRKKGRGLFLFSRKKKNG